MRTLIINILKNIYISVQKRKFWKSKILMKNDNETKIYLVKPTNHFPKFNFKQNIHVSNPDFAKI